MNANALRVQLYADGIRTIQEVAELAGLSRSGAKKICARYGLPTRRPGAKAGELNHQFVSGRRIGTDGYVEVTAPDGYQGGRSRAGKHQHTRIIFEHRLVVERKLGRLLLPGEVVDHIDGLTLHNSPENLRVFDNNAEHLSTTRAGRAPRQSEKGKVNTGTRADLGKDYQPVDTYYLRRKRGDVRLLQILRLASELGTDSPYLSGTKRWLVKAGIYPLTRSSLERGLAELYQRYEQDLLR